MTIPVLVVDDDAASWKSMAEFMRDSGFEVRQTSTAEMALAQLETSTVDTVITEIHLPDMGGLELTNIIKESYGIDVIVIAEYSRCPSCEEALNKGASDFVFKPICLEELLLRLKRLLNLRQSMEKRSLMLADFKRLAITDDLTGLFNARHFYDQLQKELDRAKRHRQQLALIMINIGYFKDYNDARGRLDGDKVLSELGECLRTGLRSADSAYRFGGEEFAVILPSSGINDAVIVAERLRRCVEKLGLPKGAAGSNPVTVSLGLTEYIRSEILTDFVRRADLAMYISKKKGRNCVTALRQAFYGNPRSSSGERFEEEIIALTALREYDLAGRDTFLDQRRWGSRRRPRYGRLDHKIK
jgi:diguanylate cyclase (GGDEF)-like protein